MPSLFTRIVLGEIPCYKIAESETCLAFLDVFPLRRGHVLVIPKLETDYLFDLPDSVLSDLMLFSKPIAAAIKTAVPCKRVGIAVIGLEVPHAHVHLVPINVVGDLNFQQEKLKPAADELEQVAASIRNALSL